MFTRVFSSILDSSLNVQSVPLSARWLWITMLLIADADRTGVVDMPLERLAARAGLSPEQTQEGLRILAAPDPDSSSDEAEGRRIVPIRADSCRGWRLVNWEKYREIASAEQKREQTRIRVAQFRERDATRTETARHGEKADSRVGDSGENGHGAFPRAAGPLLPNDGLGAVEIIERTIQVVAPATRGLDEIEISLWLRDINPDPWWIAAAICEAQAALTERPRTARYVKSIVKRCAEERRTYDNAEGYVTYFISHERQSKMNTSTM